MNSLDKYMENQKDNQIKHLGKTINQSSLVYLMARVGIKMILEDKYFPKKAHEGDASYDVYAADVRWETDDAIAYGLGFKLELPLGIRADLKARSSIYKTGLVLSNGIGTGDQGFKGEYGAVFYKVGEDCQPYKIGERIAQISFEKIREVSFYEIEKLSESDRGEGGYGSTGN